MQCRECEKPLQALDRYCARCGTPVDPDVLHPTAQTLQNANRELGRRARRAAVPAHVVATVGVAFMVPALWMGLARVEPNLFVAVLAFVGLAMMMVGIGLRYRIISRHMGWPPR